MTVEVTTVSGSVYFIDGNKMTGGSLGSDNIPQETATLFVSQRFAVGKRLLAFFQSGKSISTSRIKSIVILT